jgi:hypothetical protein
MPSKENWPDAIVHSLDGGAQSGVETELNKQFGRTQFEQDSDNENDEKTSGFQVLRL